MMVLLNEALLPNLVQTTEGAPAIVHCGPFANIAHGTSSVLAQRMGLHLADYVVNETGFAADLGAEKFFDIVMPLCGHVPSVAVVIVTLKALRARQGWRIPNLQRHLENLQRWGVPAIVALNRFPGDSDDDLAQVRAYCASLQSRPSRARGTRRGGDGMVDLADKVVAAAATSKPEARQAALRSRTCRSSERSRRSRRRCTAPTACRSSLRRKSRLQQFEQLGYGRASRLHRQDPVSRSATTRNVDRRAVGVDAQHHRRERCRPARALSWPLPAA